MKMRDDRRGQSWYNYNLFSQTPIENKRVEINIMLELCSLASGSNGNCFYIKTGDECFLVDAGISRRQICMRLRAIGSDIENICGIFITHEHSDHIRGLRVLMNHHPTPVYITEQTYRRSGVFIAEDHLKFISSNDLLQINGTGIRSLPKSHDAVDPSLFCFYYKGKKVSVITDAGYACRNVIEAVRDAHVLFLETNYDDDMLEEGYYPYYLKERIRGKAGHMSNLHAAQLVIDHSGPQLSHVFLSHLSENNNSPQAALNTFLNAVKKRKDLAHLQTVVTSRYDVSAVVRLEV